MSSSQLKIYYLIHACFLLNQNLNVQWNTYISNVGYKELPIFNHILLTYKQLYHLIQIDINRDIVDDFMNYLNEEIKLEKIGYIRGHLLGEPSSWSRESWIVFPKIIEQLNFDIDVTKSFQLSKLVENVL